jgi:ATP-binding cassette subfamily B protein
MAVSWQLKAFNMKSDTSELIRELLAGKRSRIIKMLIFFIIKSCPIWLIPIVTSRMIDLAAKSDRNYGRLSIYLAIGLVLYVQNVLTHTLYMKSLSRITRGFGSQLRVKLCRQLQTLSILYHGQTSLGKLHTKAIRDIELLENVPYMAVETLVGFLVGTLIAIVAIVIRAPIAILFFLIAVPLCAVTCNFFSRRVRRNTSEYRKMVEGMSSSFADMLTMIPITRAHGLEEQQLETVSRRIHDVYHRGLSFDITAAIFGSTAWVVMGVLQMTFLAGSIFACFKGRISVGDVVMFNSFFMILSGQLGGALNLLPQLSQAQESLNSLLEVLNAPDLETNAGKTFFTSVSGKFDFDNVSFKYPGTDSAADSCVSINIAPGQSVAFVGPSGSGKSTMLSLLLGFVRPDSGRILLDSRDMQQMDLRTYRRFVGVVTQDPVFFSGTIFENVAYGHHDFSEKEVEKALEESNAWEFVRTLPGGIHCRIGSAGINLSGGQLQRLAIARALVRDPRILILDEATSALDIDSELAVQQALESIMKNRTTFIVAHRVSTVKNADAIAVLNHGRLEHIGSPQQLLAFDNFYSRAVRQMQVTFTQ